MYGFPLFVIRRLCREGRIPCWDFRTRYLMEPEAAYEALVALQGLGNLSPLSGEAGSYDIPVVPCKRTRLIKESFRRKESGKFKSYFNSVLRG